MKPASVLLAALAVLLACSPSFAHRDLKAADQAKQRLAASPFTCAKQKAALDCDLYGDCVWCVGSKVGTGCYPMGLAKLLPGKWWECDKPLNGTAAGAQQQQAQAAQQMAGACDAKPEASCIGPACVWCTSAAVGGGCYTPEEAKKLPAAIFKCKTAPSELAV